MTANLLQIALDNTLFNVESTELKNMGFPVANLSYKQILILNGLNQLIHYSDNVVALKKNDQIYIKFSNNLNYEGSLEKTNANCKVAFNGATMVPVNGVDLRVGDPNSTLTALILCYWKFEKNPNWEIYRNLCNIVNETVGLGVNDVQMWKITYFTEIRKLLSAIETYIEDLDSANTQLLELTSNPDGTDITKVILPSEVWSAPNISQTATTQKSIIPVLPWFLKNDVPQFVQEAMICHLSNQYNGGVPGFLAVGPPGTKKTTGLKEMAAKLNLPFTKVSFAPETPREAVLGNVTTKIVNGQIQPVAILGTLTEPFRQSMLLATCLVIKQDVDKAKELLINLKVTKASDVWMNFCLNIEDKRAWAAIEEFFQPTDESWEEFEKIYFGLNVPEKGGITHILFIDELHNAVGNPAILSLIQNVMEDERKLNPSEAGFPCSSLYGYNIQIISAGNPSNHGLPPALKSRHPFISYVGFASVEEQKNDIVTALSRKVERANGKTFLQPPMVKESAFSPDYEGPKYDFDAANQKPLGKRFLTKLFAMKEKVENMYNDGKTRSRIDTRAMYALASYAQILFQVEMSEDQVAKRLVNPILSELVGYRPDGTIVSEDNFTSLRSELEACLM